MAEGSDTAAECSGLNLGDFGCLETGDISFGAIIALTPTLFGLWMKLLGGETWRIRVGLWLYDASWSTAYAGLLQKLLVRLRWFFGRPWSRRAFDACFRLAVFYACVYLTSVATWENYSTPTEKWALAGAVLVFGPTSFLIARQVRRRHLLARWGSEHRRRRLWLHLREQLTYFVFGLVAGVALFAGNKTGIGAGDAVLAGAGAVALTVTVGVAGAGAGALAVAGAVAGTVAVGVAKDGVVSSAVVLNLIIPYFAILFIIIPCLNALFDWPSWAASRWLMRRLRADATRPGFLRRVGAILVHLAIDGAIAIACLFGLAIVLINLAHAAGVQPLWDSKLSTAMEAPFSALGLAMTVMLLSTLVPTALHLFFALFALAAIRPPFRGQIAGWLEEHHGGGEWGNRVIVSAYLTFWMIFALVVLWGAAMALLRGLDGLWLRLGWGLETDPYPFWASIFRAAEAFVIF